MQQQRSAQINDIFKSIASLAAAPFTGGKSLSAEFGGNGPFGSNPWQVGGSGPSSGPGSSWDNPDYGITGTPPTGGDWLS